jgi:hypothetical protein
MKILEKIMAIVAILAIVMVYFNIPYGVFLSIISFTVLSWIYYPFGFAFFNGIHLRRIFKKESYKGVSALSIVGAIFAGMALSTLCTGILFTIASYAYAERFLSIGLFSTGLILIAVLIIMLRNRAVFPKKIFIRILTIGSLGFVLFIWSEKLIPSKQNYEPFHSYLGKEKTFALKESVRLFNSFLDDNYGDQKTKAGKAKAFLEYLSENNQLTPDSTWEFDLRKNAIIVNLFERTGLRNEIWIYGKEDHFTNDALERYFKYQDSISNLLEARTVEAITGEIPTVDDSLVEIQLYEDSIRYRETRIIPEYNSLLFVMLNNPSENSCIQKYIDYRFYKGLAREGSMITELLKCEPECYSDLYFDVIMVSEFFYFYMEANTE